MEDNDKLVKMLEDMEALTVPKAEGPSVELLWKEIWKEIKKEKQVIDCQVDSACGEPAYYLVNGSIQGNQIETCKGHLKLAKKIIAGTGEEPILVLL